MLNAADAAVVDALQGDFPICARPFAAAGQRLGIGEGELIERLRRLLDDGVLTRFGPMYDAERMGGAVSLCAMSVPAERFDAVAAEVNARVEVAHNYQREHALNMWFVVATAQADGIDAVLARIEAATGLPVYNLPKLEEYFVGLRLKTSHGVDGGQAGTRPRERKGSFPPLAAGMVDTLDRQIARASQAGLALEPMPYHRLAETVGVSPEALQERLQQLQQRGCIRRIGAVPNHYRLGYLANGMSVWDVDDDCVARHGRRIGALDAVSHCYLRPRHRPLWPYNLFVMVHGADRDEVHGQVARIRDSLGDDCRRHDVLFSTRILKKTGIRFG